MKQFHPLAEYLPIMPGHDLDELAEDIKANGLKESIVTFEDKILDGRNRFLACKKAKVRPKFKSLEDGDPVAYVIAKNISRRHLTPSQKAMAITKLIAASSGWKPAGRPDKTAPNEAVSETEAAKLAGVARTTIQRAKRKLKKPGKKDSVDAMGFPIPELALPYWNRADEVKEILKQIAKLKSLTEELIQRRDPLYSEVGLDHCRVELGNMYTTFKTAVPYVVCTGCSGLTPGSCGMCQGRGVISEFRWNSVVSRDVKTARENAVKKNCHDTPK